MRTMLVWIAPESSALPTSPTITEALPTDFSGRSLISSGVGPGCSHRCCNPCADAHISGWQNQVGIVDGMDYVHQAHVVRLELDRIDIDHDLAVASAEGLRNRCSGTLAIWLRT